MLRSGATESLTAFHNWAGLGPVPLRLLTFYSPPHAKPALPAKCTVSPGLPTLLLQSQFLSSHRTQLPFHLLSEGWSILSPYPSASIPQSTWCQPLSYPSLGWQDPGDAGHFCVSGMRLAPLCCLHVWSIPCTEQCSVSVDFNSVSGIAQSCSCKLALLESLQNANCSLSESHGRNH